MTKVFDALKICLALSPLFLLTIGGWIGGILFISAALAIIVLCAGRNEQFPITCQQKPWVWGLAISFALPVVAIFLGQFFRQDFAGRDYDSPSRFLLTIPIFIVLVRHRFDVLKPLLFSMPAALLITLIVVTLHPEAGWGGYRDAHYSRISTYFIDPLTFGSLNLTLGLCCLLSIDLYQRDAWWIKSFKGLGFLVGLYLSIVSGSRTGWLALPLVLLLWLNFKVVGYRAVTFAGLLLCLGGGYYLSDILQQRLDLAVREIMAYRWNSINPQSSVGDRLSFLRIALFLVEQSPWAGFGDQGFSAWINHPELNRYALANTQELALRSGFHNEIATNMVRSGIWGLLASCSLFFVPAVFFLGKLRSATSQTSKIALLGLSYFICTFVSGMTTEVFNLKFTASFHALMFACLLSSLLVHLAVDQKPEKNESA
ncbi:O-antigen ligase family protein [Methylomicrobium sp. Wu6]|uniref:O-antigen ligase family protein n=1 Tax=Methylomicrobium sp. Wu6 TaxID=3107928 RepID=UPI002DD65C42|nr:O-antigen ligase family protein [Methylomicrobium sp. Wu6]MEC4748760.1 O-antigen ligase family protein [Methylomicrobium sp. Wu6]